MALTSKGFEQKVAKILMLLEGQDAKVEWDARIPDPDNPSQARQVDILINRDGHLTLVECRHRSSTQDVTWIEELYGRKFSLRASAALAVSSSGFTQGARLKADALGIILRDFATLTAEEIRTWGKGTRAFLEYVKFAPLAEINIVVPVTMISSVLGYNRLFLQGNGQPWPAEEIFMRLAERVSGLERGEGSIRGQMFSRDLYVGGVKVEELIVLANYRRLQIPLLLPSVQVFGPPVAVSDSKVYIERAGSTDFEVVRDKQGAFLIADLSTVEPIKNAIFRSLLFDMGEKTAVRGVGFVGRMKRWVDSMEIKIRPIRRDSGRHLALLREDVPDPLIVLP